MAEYNDFIPDDDEEDDIYVDDEWFEGVKCDTCGEVVPLYLFADHQDECWHYTHLEFGQTKTEVKKDLINFTENPIFEPKADEDIKEIPPVENKNSVLRDIVFGQNNFGLQKVEPISKAPEEKVIEKIREDFAISDHEVLEDISTENETFAFKPSNEGKRAEEDNPSFKVSLNYANSKAGSTHLIQNVLTESDNEDGESLEEFWKRADIKLAQRLRRF